MWQADATGTQTWLRQMLTHSAEDVWIFFLFTAARQLHILLVMTVSGFFVCVLTPYPLALFMEIKIFWTAWKTSFALTWKGWIQFPRTSVGAGLSSVAKSFTSYHAATAAGAEFPFTNWLIYPFVIARYQKVLHFFPCVGFYWASATEESQTFCSFYSL